jgi:hypothetical protein
MVLLVAALVSSVTLVASFLAACNIKSEGKKDEIILEMGNKLKTLIKQTLHL